MRKVVLIYLEGLSSQFVEFMSDDLPVFNEFKESGVVGGVKSMIPGAKMVAWASAQIGQGPQKLDFWDDVYRDDFTYEISKPVDSGIFGKPREVDYRRDERDPFFRYLLKRGDKVASISVPGSWPVPRVTGGYAVACAMAPGLEQGYTWPPSLADQVGELVGEYILDVPLVQAAAGSDEFNDCVEAIRAMDEQRFSLLTHFISTKQCDTLMLGVSGPGKMARLCHECFGADGGINEDAAEALEALEDYYQFLDDLVGEVRETIDNDTVVVLLDPLGVVKLQGRFFLNQWLLDNGYLALKSSPAGPAAFAPDMVDWSRTRAWSQGKDGQLYLNIKGREQAGTVGRDQVAVLCEELAVGLEAVADPAGQPLQIECVPTDQLYSSARLSFGPDALVSVAGDAWQVSDELGHAGAVTAAAPEGAASIANGPTGYCSMFGPSLVGLSEEPQFQAMDIAPTVLTIRGHELPAYMQGKPFAEIRLSEKEKEQKELAERLTWLGY